MMLSRVPGLHNAALTLQQVQQPGPHTRPAEEMGGPLPGGLAEILRFVPASQTCAGSDGHAESDTEIVLGEMASSRTTFHCIECHEFTAPAPPGGGALDTARPAIRPCNPEAIGDVTVSEGRPPPRTRV